MFAWCSNCLVDILYAGELIVVFLGILFAPSFFRSLSNAHVIGLLSVYVWMYICIYFVYGFGCIFVLLYAHVCKFMVEGDAQHLVVEDLLIAVTTRALAILKEIKSLILIDLIYVN